MKPLLAIEKQTSLPSVHADRNPGYRSHCYSIAWDRL